MYRTVNEGETNCPPMSNHLVAARDDVSNKRVWTENKRRRVNDKNGNGDSIDSLGRSSSGAYVDRLGRSDGKGGGAGASGASVASIERGDGKGGSGSVNRASFASIGRGDGNICYGDLPLDLRDLLLKPTANPKLHDVPLVKVSVWLQNLCHDVPACWKREDVSVEDHIARLEGEIAASPTDIGLKAQRELWVARRA